MSKPAGERFVLVTGGNRGIGLEVVQQLARRGFHVVIAARGGGKAEEAAKKVHSTGGQASGIALDVSDSASIRAAARTLAERIPHLDVLINNAGIYPDKGLTILTVSREQMVNTLQTNTFGPLEVTQAFIPLLQKAGSARVINVSSGYGQLEGLSPGVPSYCLSKLALNGVTIMLAAALRDTGIVVNSVCPGWVRTDMGGANAPRSIEQGAEGIVWLAAEAPANLTDGFFRDGKPIPW